ncbi:hypothetical protein L3i23_18270 [Herbiconiux sp. L3-i23]|nr:hypothetical protein L3i23_18270 [Herbiconiux sp. L3-i23]
MIEPPPAVGIEGMAARVPRKFRNPQIAPARDPREDIWRVEAGVYAAIAAAGTVAGIERWLLDPGGLDQEALVQLLLRGNAEWWERPVGD